MDTASVQSGNAVWIVNIQNIFYCFILVIRVDTGDLLVTGIHIWIWAKYLYLYLRLKVLTILDIWWRLLWGSKPELAPLFAFGGGLYITCSLRFTSGATPVDILATSTIWNVIVCHCTGCRTWMTKPSLVSLSRDSIQEKILFFPGRLCCDVSLWTREQLWLEQHSLQQFIHFFHLPKLQK